MRRPLSLAPLLLAAIAACHNSKPTNTVAADTAANRSAQAGARLAAQELERELLAWVTVADMERTLTALLGPGGSPQRGELFQAIGISAAVADAMDLRRAFVLGLLDPRQHAGRQRAPLVVQVPITSRQAFRAALGSANPELPGKGGALIYGAG